MRWQASLKNLVCWNYCAVQNYALNFRKCWLSSGFLLRVLRVPPPGRMSISWIRWLLDLCYALKTFCLKCCQKSQEPDLEYRFYCPNSYTTKQLYGQTVIFVVIENVNNGQTVIFDVSMVKRIRTYAYITNSQNNCLEVTVWSTRNNCLANKICIQFQKYIQKFI